ncbi:phosphoribosyl-ATP pyrophosphatase [Alkalihalobacillus alcalophilus ATCC 27647 = CGMCC 1.3604]|uniref:Histidine biosynthesis bifunctional protein HisIE n=1 Tax=Alkalihalobacillus alcalophilus ATCC 27647 = CGMCC 1.3604 TaxID=1218173 RepID=A0A094XFI9_ALKAL|nr:bifunctional phosphoribosyl-AMP cyclohydrolase/phosphoribosyl-ATP diphosphatase HisIE [Alkalihalobacillus alcalophilus]KGA97555.1 phosphoribosyl-ATP pyrophosphatase [Alkalihalobacillus alcalophilus ATCC 27647 = CGMCC 1.3604]MED1562981.1 bifunctional phosphoribosyl-AMP cyclohydrolase/phosphoribosyl-ATP diphosphatase HisIE [Alkalihalobacillus alcalophilus]THG91122.1 phosphoribosyl-ATP pyrophosphatase [Alkalihalobacillus alcalophilus ATCC 27647 = CGMCC 1.3604]
MNIEKVRFDEKGLVSAIVQDAVSKEVLTLAYMNKESLKKSLETKETWFYSRSRQELWHKGGTSGNTQSIIDIRFDCDADALLVLVEPAGPACHTGSYTCFTNSLVEEPSRNDEQESIERQKLINGRADRYAILNELESVIATREAEMPEGAYTTYLFEKGVDKILKKVGEEAGEVIIAAKNRDPEELKWEVADLLYHLLVLLREQKLPIDEVLAVLEERHSGS